MTKMLIAMPTLSTLSTLSTLMLLTQAVMGQPGGPGPHDSDIRKPPPEKMISHLDTDGDGLISFEEFKVPDHRRRGYGLGDADSDGDGNISRAEMEAQLNGHLEAITAKAEARFTHADQNGDDFVTPDERKQVAFEMIDANGDGYLSPEELARAQKRDKRARH